MRGRATDESYAYCRDLVRQADKDRFLSSLFAPGDRRDHLYALLAFDVEVVRVREKVSDALPGEVRLQWWCEALAGCGHGEVSRHPVAAALLDTLERHDLPSEPLIDLVESHSFDLYDEPMATMSDLEAYLVATASVPMRMSAMILGAADGDELRAAARDGGIACGLVGLLRVLGRHAGQGKLYVPEELLARHGVAPHDILAGRRGAGLDAALAELRCLAEMHRARAAELLASLPHEAAPAMLPLALVRPYLDRMEKQGHDPFAECTIPQWRRQWILWRAARRGCA